MPTRQTIRWSVRAWLGALIATVLTAGTIIIGAPAAIAGGGPPPVEITITAQPTTVGPGGATLVTFLVTNHMEAGTAQSFSLDATANNGASFDYNAATFSDSNGSCQTIEESTSCNLGDIPPGGGTASAQIPLDIATGTQSGTTVTIFGHGVYIDDDSPVGTEALPITVTVSNTSPPGSASGFVPPGGSLNTGKQPSPGAKDTVVLFKLPKQSAGAAMTITTSPCSPGDCFGHVVTFTPFSGTTDPSHPARIRLRWDPSVTGTGTAGNLYKNPDNSPTQVLIPKCVRAHGAITASPCVQTKRVLRNGVVQFIVLVLSGDPSMRRR
jgi:hypothetical protein